MILTLAHGQSRTSTQKKGSSHMHDSILINIICILHSLEQQSNSEMLEETSMSSEKSILSHVSSLTGHIYFSLCACAHPSASMKKADPQCRMAPEALDLTYIHHIHSSHHVTSFCILSDFKETGCLCRDLDLDDEVKDATSTVAVNTTEDDYHESIKNSDPLSFSDCGAILWGEGGPPQILWGSGLDLFWPTRHLELGQRRH